MCGEVLLVLRGVFLGQSLLDAAGFLLKDFESISHLGGGSNDDAKEIW